MSQRRSRQLRANSGCEQSQKQLISPVGSPNSATDSKLGHDMPLMVADIAENHSLTAVGIPDTPNADNCQGNKPQKHDYAAAATYLSLTMDRNAAKAAAGELEKADMTKFAAKDIFRASGLSLLGTGNSHVEKDRAKINREEKLSPLLLYRDKTISRLIIADGYHRVCAVYTFDEDAMIPCKIA
jgi:hypothetical protein